MLGKEWRVCFDVALPLHNLPPSFDICSHVQDEHARLLANQDKDYEKKASEVVNQHKDAVIKIKSFWDRFKQDIMIIHKSSKTMRQKNAAYDAKSLLRKNDCKDEMQVVFRDCRTKCDSHLKDLEKKAKEAKKPKSGDLSEIQKLLAGMFRD